MEIKTKSGNILVVEITPEEDLIDNIEARIISQLDDAKIIGKLSKLKDKDVEEFVDNSIKGLTNEITYRDYTFEDWEECFEAKESFLSLLESNGLNTNKEYLIVKIL